MIQSRIVVTLGPASGDQETIGRLVQAGASAVRINMSHARPADLSVLIGFVRKAESLAGRFVPVFVDLRGPKLRTGEVRDGSAVLNTGAAFVLTSRPVEGDGTQVSTDYPPLAREAGPGRTILLDDGKIVLLVETVRDGTDLICRVVKGGMLGSRKGIALPGVELSIPALTPKDEVDARAAVEAGADGLFLSFVRHPSDIGLLRDLLASTGRRLPVIAKIETAAAVGNLEGIVAEADGLLVARGDLGVELPLWDVPGAQQRIVAASRAGRKPVIVATEMLESMIRNPRPTRAEVSDVASAILGGVDAVMLSGETAVGSHPVEAVEVMRRVIESTERHTAGGTLPASPEPIRDHSLAEGVCTAAVQLARHVGARAIVLFSVSGFTARLVSHRRPEMPVYAFTDTDGVARWMALLHGVEPIASEHHPEHFSQFIRSASELLVERGMLDAGDRFVAVAGSPLLAQGTTNSIRVWQVVGQRDTDQSDGPQRQSEQRSLA